MARTSAKIQTLTGTQKPPKPRSSRKRPEKVPLASPVLDIPYFADMQLNPARYPLGELFKSPCYDHIARILKRSPATFISQLARASLCNY
jgi:hypothetical protein